MLILEVKVKHFGLLDYFEVKFGDKLNVIEGSNESGKSTLAAFVRFMLYGFTPDPAGLEERRKRTSWETGTAEGEMTVLVKGKRYRIDRYSAIVQENGREIFRDRTRVVNIDEGSLVTEKDAGEYFLGVPSDVFSSSAYISQMDDTHVGEEKMRETISNLLFSGNEQLSVDKAAAAINARRVSETEEHGVGSRTLLARAEELIAEEQRAVEITETLLERESELVENQKEREKVELEIAKLEKLKGSFRAIALLNSFDKLHTLEQEERLLHAEEAEFRMKHTGNGFLPDSSYRTELSINRRVTADAYRTYRAAGEEWKQLKEKIEDEREEEKLLHRIDRHGGDAVVSREVREARKSGTNALLLMILCFGLAVFLPILGAILSWNPATALYLVLAGVSLVGGGIFTLLYRGHFKRARALAGEYGFKTAAAFAAFLAGNAERRVAITEREQALRHAEDVVDRTKKTYLATYSSLSATVARWGRSLPESGVGAAIDKMVEEIDAILAAQADFAEREKALEAELNALRGKLAGENEEHLRHSLSPELQNMLCDMSFEALLDGINQRNLKKQDLEKHRLDLEDEIAGLRQGVSNPVEIREKIEILRDRIRAASELKHALDLAYSAVSGAEGNLRREITPRLSAYAGRLMSAMTDGKYGQLGVNQDLFLDFTREEGDRYSAEYLSGGTRDLAYIALRLAYIDLLYKDEKPPLCFDESFAHQDNFRATCTMRALRELAEDGVQSLIFTCRSRESTIAREVDRKYHHIKIEKLRADQALAQIEAERARREAEEERRRAREEAIRAQANQTPPQPAAPTVLLPGIDYPETEEEHRAAEEARLAEENRIAEEARIAEENRIAEETARRIAAGDEEALFDEARAQPDFSDGSEEQNEDEDGALFDGEPEDGVTESNEDLDEETVEEIAEEEPEDEPEEEFEEEPEEEPEDESEEEAEAETPAEEGDLFAPFDLTAPADEEPEEETEEETEEESDVEPAVVIEDEPEEDLEEEPEEDEDEEEPEEEPEEEAPADESEGDLFAPFDLSAPEDEETEEETDGETDGDTEDETEEEPEVIVEDEPEEEEPEEEEPEEEESADEPEGVPGPAPADWGGDLFAPFDLPGETGEHGEHGEMISELIAEQGGPDVAFQPAPAAEPEPEESEEPDLSDDETEEEPEEPEEDPDEAERRRQEALEAARLAREQDEEERLFGFGPRRDD